MYSLLTAEVSDLLAAIELGWAKRRTEADFNGDFGEGSFYEIDGRVFHVEWMRATTITRYFEVSGDNLELYRLNYGPTA